MLKNRLKKEYFFLTISLLVLSFYIRAKAEQNINEEDSSNPEEPLAQEIEDTETTQNEENFSENAQSVFDDQTSSPGLGGTDKKTSTKKIDPVEKKIPAAEIVGLDETGLDDDLNAPKVNLEFKGASLQQVIQTIGEEHKINFIFPNDVGANKVFLSMKNTSWTKALQAILETYGLGMIRLKGDIVRIDKLEKLEEEKKHLAQVKKSASMLIPTKVLVMRLSYAKATEITDTVEKLLQARGDDRVKVKSDERTNAIIVEAIPQDLAKVKAIVERLDLQTPQVKIESRVIEVIKSIDRFLGIEWGGPFRYDQGRGLGFGNIVFPNNLISKFAVDPGSFNSSPTGNFEAQLGSINNSVELNLRLKMSELNKNTRSLQDNSVVVLNNQTAKIEAGVENFFEVQSENQKNVLASVKFQITLDVTPHITADGSIQMKIKVENSTPIDSGAGKSKSIRLLETSMIRKNGETAVIGGLYNTKTATDYRGIPFLSRIPILGALFKSQGHSQEKRELIILVTPKIINSKRALAYKTNIKNSSAQSTNIKNNENIENENQTSHNEKEEDEL